MKIWVYFQAEKNLWVLKMDIKRIQLGEIPLFRYISLHQLKQEQKGFRSMNQTAMNASLQFDNLAT